MMNRASSSCPHSVAAIAVLAAILLLPATPAGADQIAYECDGDLCLVDPDAGSGTNLTTTTTITEGQPAWSPAGTRLAYYGLPPGAGWDLFQLTVANPDIATNVSQTTDRTEGASPIQWSPGGERIAFGATYNSNAPPDLGFDVFVSPASGTAPPTAIGSTSASESGGRWSPDGTKIAFARRQAGAGGIYVGKADGTDTPAFVPDTGAGIQPDWSPDGTRIATVIDSGSDTIRVVRVDGTGTPVTLGDTTGLIVQGPFFSPDGSRVMWKTQNTIFIRAADGSGTTTMITGPNGMPGYPMSWSPNGTRVAFSGFDQDFNIDLFVANADGSGAPRAVATAGYANDYPAWKPDPDAGSPSPVDPTDPDPQPQPPTDPPVTPTRPPVTISLANFRQPRVVYDGRIPFVPIAYISCSYPTPKALAAGCKFDADGIYNSSAKSGPRNLRATKKKQVKFGRGSASLAYDESGQLRLKVSKAGRKLLKPGRKLKIKVTVRQRIGTDPVVTTKRTLKLKVPKKSKG